MSLIERIEEAIENKDTSTLALLLADWDNNRTTNQKEVNNERVFQYYKQDLIKTKEISKNIGLRFNVIEYVCNFSKINPYVMAASIKKDGITILYDDSSISKEENRRKEKQVNKLLS